MMFLLYLLLYWIGSGFIVSLFGLLIYIIMGNEIDADDSSFILVISMIIGPVSIIVIIIFVIANIGGQILEKIKEYKAKK